MHALKTEPALSDSIQASQFDRAGQPQSARRQILWQGSAQGSPAAWLGGGKGRQVLTKPWPLQQLEGFLQHGSSSQSRKARQRRHQTLDAAGSDWLEGIPPGGS